LALQEAKQLDLHEHNGVMEIYHENYDLWKEIHQLAEEIFINGYQSYLKIYRRFNPFEDIDYLYGPVNLSVISDSLIIVTFQATSENEIPSEIKTQLKTGKLSIKNMPKGKFYELYRDHVSSSTLRISLELFALLPVDTIIITAEGNLLITQTGYSEKKSILSVAIPRDTLASLNLEMINPSDAINNFVNRVNFKKTKGFSGIEALKSSEF